MPSVYIDDIKLCASDEIVKQINGKYGKLPKEKRILKTHRAKVLREYVELASLDHLDEWLSLNDQYFAMVVIDIMANTKCLRDSSCDFTKLRDEYNWKRDPFIFEGDELRVKIKAQITKLSRPI